MDSLHLTKTAKDQLATLKRRTGIAHNNVLCRWALCRSLAEPSSPQAVDSAGEGGFEIKWETFAGEQGPVLVALVRDRCLREGLPADEDAVSGQLRLHVHRGIGYLFGDRQAGSIAGLLSLTRRGEPAPA